MRKEPFNSTSYTVRIDGNPNYHYCKTTVRYINDSLFIVNSHLEGYFSYDYLCEEYVQSQPFGSYQDLLRLLWENLYGMKKAVKKLEDDEKLESVYVEATIWMNNEQLKVKGLTISHF